MPGSSHDLVAVGCRAAEGRAAGPGHDLHVEDLLDAVSANCEGRHGAAGAEVDDPDAALELVAVRRDRHAAEDRRLADLRQARRTRGRRGTPGRGCSPGTRGHVSRVPVARSTSSSRARARSPAPRAGRRASAASAAWPDPCVTASPPATSSTAPLSLRACRQPPGSSLGAITVTYAGGPSRIARPLRWQRSSAASRETNGGRQRGTKL